MVYKPFSIFLLEEKYILYYRDQDGNRISGWVQNL
jgi:hypothetical protein